MSAYSSRFRSGLAVSIVILFSVLSFNAYACILPVISVPATTMGTGCSTPEEAPVYQVCDVFKTLGVQFVDRLPVDSDGQALAPEDTVSLVLRVLLTSHSRCLYDHPPDGPPQDLLLKISVLRI